MARFHKDGRPYGSPPQGQDPEMDDLLEEIRHVLECHALGVDDAAVALDFDSGEDVVTIVYHGKGYTITVTKDEDRS